VQLAVYIGVIVAAYFLGSIPTGYLTGRARGVDIRTAGSGNIGATNTLRVLGRKAGAFVLLGDAVKGFVAARYLGVLALALVPQAQGKVSLPYLGLAAAAASVLGHNYTCWLRFKGGKGISTSCGAILAVVPLAGVIILATWILVFAATRYVSAASVAAAAILPFAAWYSQDNHLITAVMAGLGLLAILKHRANIGRLLAGTEPRFGRPKKLPEAAAAGGAK